MDDYSMLSHSELGGHMYEVGPYKLIIHLYLLFIMSKLQILD